MDESVQAKLRKGLEQNNDVLAAYLFGSITAEVPVRNDVDILVLLREDVDRFEAYTHLKRSMADASGLPEGKIDLLFLDLDIVQEKPLGGYPLTSDADCFLTIWKGASRYSK